MGCNDEWDGSTKHNATNTKHQLTTRKLRLRNIITELNEKLSKQQREKQHQQQQQECHTQDKGIQTGKY